MKKECKECGEEMVIRTGRYGQFWGCEGYPDCTNKDKLKPGEGNDINQINMSSNGVKEVSTKNIGIERRGLFTAFALAGFLSRNKGKSDKNTVDRSIEIGRMMEDEYEKQDV